MRNIAASRLKRLLGGVLGPALLILLAAVILLEGLARLGWVQPRLPSLGTGHVRLEVQLARLDALLQEEGPPDCLIVSHSFVWTGVNPEVVQQAYYERTGRKIRCFNAGIPGMVRPTLLVDLAESLVDKYHPELVLVVVSLPHFFDQPEETEMRVVLLHPWFEYHRGAFSVSGWLWEHSQAYRSVSALAQDWLSLRYYRQVASTDKLVNRYGYAPRYGRAPEINPEEVRQFCTALRVKLAPQQFAALGRLNQLKAHAQVIVLEPPVSPLFTELVLQGCEGEPVYRAASAAVSDYTREQQLDYWPAPPSGLIPPDGWNDLLHLNDAGATLYSRWLGEELAGAVMSGKLKEPIRLASAHARRESMVAFSLGATLQAWQSWVRGGIQVVSIPFAVLTLLVMSFYYRLPRQGQNWLLLAASYVFCATWSWVYALILLVITLVNYALARGLQPGERRGSRWLLWLGIGFNLAALIAFKYEKFFLVELFGLLWRSEVFRTGLQAGLLPYQVQNGVLNILIPLGLSYYILQAIAMLVDVQRGRVKIGRLVDFALYMAYFPRLLAGPIERPGNLLSQLAARRVVDAAVLDRSLTLILLGLVRKAVFADSLRILTPAAVFETPRNFAAPVLAGWLAVYVFTLYNDFAGYTGIVRGVSGLFGIHLSPNFAWPFFAHNFSEFWNRWHISLSHWLRDYIYFPLSRALRARFRSPGHLVNLLAPPLITMLASGLWHGFNAGMLLWGGMHGTYLVVERFISLRCPEPLPDERPAWQRALAALLVFILVALAFVPFRLGLPAAWDYWRGLLLWPGFPSLSDPDMGRLLFRAAIFIALSLCLDWIQQRGVKQGLAEDAVFLRWPSPLRVALLTLALLAIWVVSLAGTGELFVYQGF